MCHLREMNAVEFDHYTKTAIQNYADELVKSGIYPKENSLAQAQKVYSQLLPDGLNTKDQYLFHVINETDAIIGMIWFGKKPNAQGFIYDFMIDEHFRNQGFGTKTLELIEEKAKLMGINKLNLHVFGHNFNAISLYKKMGYTIYSMNMSKELEL